MSINIPIHPAPEPADGLGGIVTGTIDTEHGRRAFGLAVMSGRRELLLFVGDRHATIQVGELVNAFLDALVEEKKGQQRAEAGVAA